MLVRFGLFTLDTATRLLTRKDEGVHLTPKAFELLVLLVAEAPRVLAKPELHQRLWRDSFVSDATLAGLVKELRHALDDSDQHHPVIRTIHRVGYAFCLQPERLSTPATRDRWHWLVLKGRRIALHDGNNAIGRDPTCDIVIDAPGISRRHARIVVAGGCVRIEDLGSKNGTSVRDVKITTGVDLHDGDRMKFGPQIAVYRSSGAGMSTQTQASNESGPITPATDGHGHR